MRGVGWWLLVCVVAFAALPLDAQYAVLAPLRLLWLTDGGRMVLLGLVGGVVGAMAMYSFIWNAAMHALYLEDMKKAEETYRKRRK